MNVLGAADFGPGTDGGAAPPQDESGSGSGSGSAPSLLLGRRATTISWAVFTLIALVMSFHIVRDDFRHHPVIGDSSAYLLQAESLGFAGHDLSYNAQDLAYYRDFEWAPVPYGLYFQKNDDGWAFAKPYGYSVVLAPYIRAFGPRYGVSLANLSLMAVLGLIGAATLRLRYRGAVVPIVLGTFLFASPFFFYAFHAWVEVFFATLVAATFYALIRAARDPSVPWAVAAVALVAFLFTEKAPALPLVLPLSGLVAWRLPGWKARTAVGLAGGMVLVLFCIPYLAYSDGKSWNAYGGDRYYARSSVPFDGDDGGAGYSVVDSSEVFSLGYMAETAFEDIPDKARSGVYYLVGRHTGMLPFMPLAVFVLFLAFRGARDLDRTGQAILFGIFGYIAFYVVFFPENYNGGGQTLGNRYFLQAYPAVLALVAAMQAKARTLVIGAVASSVVALAFMSHHYQEPSRSLLELDETNVVQRVLPFETNQIGADYFRCGIALCPEDE